MNSDNSDNFEGTFHPVLLKSGFWICAQYTQTENNSIHVKVWESSDYTNDKMKSLHFLGLVLKALHLAQGGDPSRAQGLSSITSPLSFPLPNGVLHSTTVTPTGDGAGRHTLETAWPFLFCDLSAATGMMGSVEDKLLENDLHQIQVEFGPAVLSRPAILPPDISFNAVELSATLNTITRIKPGG